MSFIKSTVFVYIFSVLLMIASILAKIYLNLPGESWLVGFVAAVLGPLFKLQHTLDSSMTETKLGIASICREIEAPVHRVALAVGLGHAEQLRKVLPAGDFGQVYAAHLDEVIEGMDGIANQELILDQDSIERYVSMRVHALSNLPDVANMTFSTTHIINSEIRGLLWDSHRMEEQWLAEYINAQRTILNRGGRVERVFIVDGEWLNSDMTKIDILTRVFNGHDERFDGTANKIKTRVGVLNNSERVDITILNKREVFLWNTDAGLGAPIRGGKYVTDVAKVKRFVAEFDRQISGAVSPEEFLARTRARANKTHFLGRPQLSSAAVEVRKVDQ